MLVGTGAIRTWLALDEGDREPNAKIESLSQAIQGFVEGQCHRKFEGMLYKTNPQYCYFDGSGARGIYLPQYPVWYINEFNVDADRSFGSATQISTSDLVLYEGNGRVISDAGSFTRGNRNCYVEYYAGYAAGTHNSHDGLGTISYAVPPELTQLIVEMVTQSMKEGITAVHTVTSGPAGTEQMRFMQMLTKNSAWKRIIDNYTNFGAAFE